MKTQEHWVEEAKRRLQSLARGEELFADYWTKRYLENLKYLLKAKGRRILDIGCGDAKYFIKVSDKFEEFYGIGLSKIHFESAKNVFPNANYIITDGSILFKDNSFDVIISFGAFEHNEDIDSIFKECYRVLKEDGVLFSVPNYVSPYFPYCYIFHTIRGHHRIAAIGHYYTKRELISKLKEQGFCKIRIIDPIFAAPVPIIGLVAGLAARLIKKMCNPRSYANPVTEEKGRPQGNKLEKLRGIVKNLDYLYSKAFYPFERFGFGFMRVIYCEK